MAFSLNLGGLFTQDKAKSKSKTTEESTKTSDRTTSTTGEQTATGNQETLTQLFDAETLGLLQSLVQQFGGELGAGGSESSQAISELASLLGERAATAQEDITALFDPILAQARREGESQLQSQETTLARNAGGSGRTNTTVASATAQGRADLETQLAALESELNLSAREAQTQELLNAISGESQAAATSGTETATFATLLENLRGAQASTTTSSEQQATSSEEVVTKLIEELDSLIRGRQKGTSTRLGFEAEGSLEK